MSEMVAGPVARATRARQSYAGDSIAFRISSAVGNRPADRLEKIGRPSTTTSNTPPRPSMRTGVVPRVSLILAARPAAFGR
jgi:hypothetical protein